MKEKNPYIPMLIVALALGTAWAVRGKFGHEQGAAWGGALGALAVILVARRNDWYQKVFKVVLASAFGWGIGGMISYGVVVGYGRGVDFVNVYYGLLMLFVIGALYGFLGGGFFALALADTPAKKVKWHFLIVEMVAWGLITYAFLINQLEWFMTPPRSEMWAACLGASIAVAWYCIRTKNTAALKVAAWSALGAGFGFAFGNFLQVLGNVAKVHFSFWNVMEYSIGFFGGLGMAYGTLTSQWAVSEEKPGKNSILLQVFLLVVFIPFVVWDQSFVSDRLEFMMEAGGSEAFVFAARLIALVCIIIVATIILIKSYRKAEVTPGYDHAFVANVFILYIGLYIFLSFLVTGLYVHPLEQYLYLVNLAVILFMLPRMTGDFYPRDTTSRTWITATGIVLLTLAVLTIIAINTHGELKGSQMRFKL